jgi:hypothetical protein
MELGHSQGRRVNERGETVEAEFLMETGTNGSSAPLPHATAWGRGRSRG